MTVVGDKVFKVVIKVKRGPNSRPYSNRTGVLRRRERHQTCTHTQKRPREDREDDVYMPMSSSGGTSPAHTLISDC